MASRSVGDEQPLRSMAATLRRWILEQSFEAGVGHIGSALSIVDIMTVLWGAVLRDAGTRRPDRDRFVLAKGHAALALYCALRWKGLLEEATFHTYCRDGSAVGVHPEHSLPGVDVSTGSLGQGLSVACGLAYGLRLRRSPARVYALLSDAECNEGQVWEAAMFAAHHGLTNLTAIVDLNGTQAMGPTRQVLDLAPLAERWRAFGWDAVEVDGHDLQALHQALTPPATRPRLIAARTSLGKGVAFMENRVEWHYRNLTNELFAQSLAGLEVNG